MAKVVRAGWIELSDYFNRFGFGDGDDAVDVGAGQDWREKAIEILQEIMKVKGLDWKAEEQDLMTHHNPIRIIIKDRHGKDIYLEAEYSGDPEKPSSVASNMDGDDPDWITFMEKVWPNAFKEFEKAVYEGEKDRIE